MRVIYADVRLHTTVKIQGVHDFFYNDYKLR